MKAPPFEGTPEFEHFRRVMKQLVAVPKTELDEQVRLHDKKAKRKRAAKKRATRPP